MINDIVPRTLDDLLKEIAEQNALIDELSHDPGFGVPTAAYTRRAIGRLAPGRVGIAVGDIRNLKQWNTATGSQERTDELLRPALQVRQSDVLIFGKRDGGDQFILVTPGSVYQVAGRINAVLEHADVTDAERQAYLKAACIKEWGPWRGRVLARCGLGWINPYPEIDWQYVDDIDVRDIHAAASAAERRLFGMKGARA
jgi:hypothetical protein